MGDYRLHCIVRCVEFAGLASQCAEGIWSVSTVNVAMDTHVCTCTQKHTHTHTYTHTTCRYYFQVGSTDALERKLDESQRELQIPPERHVPVKWVALLFL